MGLPVKVSATRQYTAAQVQLFKKVLHGAPITWDGANPFAAAEFIDPLPFVERLLKEDETRISCFVLPSSIDHPEAGEGLYSSMNNFVPKKLSSLCAVFHVTFGKYFGVLAFVLDSDKKFNFFGHQNRAILLKAQPFLSTELGPARIYIVGSLNCALTYMNTVKEDTVWKPACPQVSMFMKASKDYLADPKSVLNVVFEETSCEHYNTITKTFPSWSIFCN